jgi:DNA-binding transcriptional MerR regulator
MPRAYTTARSLDSPPGGDCTLEGVLKIGDFSRLSRVTIKALRLYDRAGLLRPAHVDRATGYRSYDHAQLEAVGRILVLKDLGFRLHEIRALLADPSSLDAALETRRDSLAAGIAADAQRLRRLDALRQGLRKPEPMPPVTVRAIEPVLALTAREVVDPTAGRTTELFETLERDAGRAKARADASPFLLLHEHSAREDRLDLEVCVPVKASALQRPHVRLVEGAAVAGSVVYRGSYDQTPALLAQLAEWISLNGGAIAGPLREVYHRFGADRRGYSLPERVLAANSAEFVTELQAPMAVANEARP